MVLASGGQASLQDLDSHCGCGGTGHAPLLPGETHNIAPFSIRRQIETVGQKGLPASRRFHQILPKCPVHGGEARLRILQVRSGL